MSDPRSPFSADPPTERVSWSPITHAAPVYAPSARPVPAPAVRRSVRPGLVLGAVLATALLTAGATYVVVHGSDGGRAPAAANVPVATASSSPTPTGTSRPHGSAAPIAPGGGQPVARPWLGIHVVMLDPAIAQANNLPVESGAWITASTTQSGQGSIGGASASEEPNAESSPGTDADGEGTQGTDPNPQSSPGPDADGEGQVPAGQAPAGGAARTGDAVIPGSPADKAGLQAGDIITAVDGTPVDATHSLNQVLRGHAPGDVVMTDVLRSGQHTTISVTLGTRPGNG